MNQLDLYESQDDIDGENISRSINRIIKNLAEIGIEVIYEWEGCYIQFPDGLLKVENDDLKRLDERARRDLKNIVEDFKIEHIDIFKPNEDTEE